MKTKTFNIFYLDRGQWTNLKDNFNSIDDAKKHIDSIRKEGTHKLCLNHHVVIYEMNGKMITGEGVRY